MKRWPLVVALAGPTVVGALVALALWRAHPTRMLHIGFALWLVPVEIGVVVALVAAAALAHHMAIARTARTAAAAAASEGAQRALAEHRRFVSRLDHELKNPLTAMRAALTNLAALAPTDARLGAALTGVDAQVLRLVRITSDLRKLAAVETAPLDIGPIPPEPLLAEVADDGAELGRAIGPPVRVELDLPRRPWPLATVWGDRDLLHLALLNLVGNAVKFSPPGGTVTLGARDDVGRDGVGRLTVEVTDSGTGIPQEELPLIWEELARGSAARGTPGSGIGLAMVRVIVARHGGEASVRSVAGRGTVVTIRLPVQPAPRPLAGTGVADPVQR